MKLATIRVKNFRCVEDSTEFTACPVTCLVGKNGAGKTSLLEALYKLNPNIEQLADFDVLSEYPRARRREYEQHAETDPDDALITQWELEPEELEQLERFLRRSLGGSNRITVRKGYYQGRRWELVPNCVSKRAAEKESEDAGESASAEGDEGGSPQGDAPGEQEHAAKPENGVASNHSELLEAMGRSANGLNPETLSKALETKLGPKLPRFLYFSEWNVMKGRVSLDALLARKERGELTGPDRIFLALLQLGGTTPEALTSIEQSEQLIADLEDAAKPITEEIGRYWSQERGIRVTFHLHPGRAKDPAPFDKGLVFETRIVNPRTNLSLNFDERSTGFAWFFSFLVWYSEVRKQHGENIIILLDDPGVGLHAKAQWDLVRYIADRLEPVYQVVYATHSPFMIDPQKLGWVRTVEDTTERTADGQEVYAGTKVGDKMLSGDHDTLLPLKASLGYRIVRSISAESRVLLVERPEEMLYLRWFSARLKEAGRRGLDPQVSLVPCGDLVGLASLVGLMSEGNTEFAVLLSLPAGCEGVGRYEEMERLLGSARVLLLNKFAAPQGSTVEDLIGPQTYAAMVDMSFKIPRGQRFARTVQAPGDVPIVQWMAEQFAARQPGRQFDSLIPAEHLLQKGGKAMRRLPGAANALDRFEQLFEEIG